MTFTGPWVRIPPSPLQQELRTAYGTCSDGLAVRAVEPADHAGADGGTCKTAAMSPDDIQHDIQRDVATEGASYEPAMRLALVEARAALDHHDVPVGAVVLREGEVIAARHNERELTGDPTAHAEVLALRDAAIHIGHWRLDDCTLVVTLEPCVMCAGAMVNSRLGHLVYGTPDPKAGAAGSCFDLVDSPVLNHRVDRTTGVLARECSALLKDFFRARR